ncbi:MAG TPA: cytochrome P450 [Anaerolineaceae bacterium]|nr:cytochrome P450 [Anaerolineaceae bacterium]
MTTKMSEPTRAVMPAGPRGFPVVGVLPKVWRDPLNFFLQAGIDYGPVARLEMGAKVFYLVTGPEEVKYVLQDHHHNYRKGYDQARPLMGNGLVTSEGSFWLKQRRLIQPMFNRGRLAFFSNFMTQATEEMLQRWQTAAERGDTLDMADEMMRLTQTIIVRAMFSTEIGDQAGALGTAFDEALGYLNRVLFSPSPLLTTLPTPANRRHQRALQYLDDFIYGLITAKRRSGEDSNDLLSLLVFSRDEETGEGMDDRQIRDELMTIFLAGHETTANALAWTWYLLSKNPQVETRLVAEIDSVLDGQPPAMDDLQKLVYTPLVLHEALRLYPPAWMFARHAVEDDVVGGYAIPKGEMLMFSPYVTHRLPEHWPKPDRFDPERFLPERSQDRHRFAYYPFGGGPRLCLGNNFALTEAQLVLARVLQRFRLHLIAGVEVRPTPIATLQPRPGVPMTLEPR